MVHLLQKTNLGADWSLAERSKNIALGIRVGTIQTEEGTAGSFAEE